MIVYSFDLWNTLIKSNPEFKKQRDLFLYNFTGKELSFGEFESVVEFEGQKSNKKGEITGIHVPCTHTLYNIFSNGYFSRIPTLLQLNLMSRKLQILLVEYAPSLYDETTFETLYKLNLIPNVKLDIRSNLVFSRGQTLRIILEKLEIGKFFDEMFFSDEIGYCKPYRKMFEQGRPLSNVEQWIHVGDSLTADKPCEELGIKFVQVNTNGKQLSCLL